jgi:hypothetical protein
MTVLRFLRIAFAAALIAVVSGVPQAAYAALVDDCCAERCEGDPGGKRCPPNCPSASCAKVFPSAVPLSGFEHVPTRGDAEPRPALAVAPTLPLVLSGVFHPPRR